MEDCEDQIETLRQKQKNILAVGAEIDFSSITDLIFAELRRNDPGFKPVIHKDVEITDTLGPANYKLAPNVALAGLFYGSKARGRPVGTYIWDSSDKELFVKYRKMHQRVLEDSRAFIKCFHISNNNNIVVGEVRIDQDAFYVFFRNTGKVATSLIKKEVKKVGSRHYNANYRCVSFDRRELSYRPYIHYSTNGKTTVSFAPL